MLTIQRLSVRFITAFLVVGMLGSILPFTNHAEASAGFRKWIKGFERVARKNGIPRSVYRRAFKGIRSPDPEVLELARYQPEFRQKLWMYFDSRVNDQSIALGQSMDEKWGRWLSRIERKYGVDRTVLLAIWSMESGYGEALAKPKSLRSVIRSLATLAYSDRRRRKFARGQLIGALKILKSGRISAQKLRGSWAGAMGHTQFIPTSYLAYGQDMDGNGSKDIWGSVPDALATAANLLRRNGWRKGQTWGYEVKVPKKAARLSGKTLSVSNWAKRGVRRANGRKFPRGGDRAVLKFPSGRSGPAFFDAEEFLRY